MIIDFHTHYVPVAYLDYVRRNGKAIGREIVTVSSGENYIKDKIRTFPLERGFHDAELTISHMMRRGIDCHVVSAPPFMFHYEQSVGISADMAELFNDEAMALCARHGERFAAMATIPLQDTKRGVAELERVCKLGLRAVEIGASINERELDDPELESFWEAAQKLDALVFIHPVRPPGRERMLPYHLFNLVGFLAETTLAASRLIFSGLLDRYPQLKICLAHTGGMLPWIAGRLDQGYAKIDACRKHIERKPSEYLDIFYYDTITYHPNALAYAVNMLGSERITMGSDYPFAIADDDPLSSVNAVPSLTCAEAEAICGGTAARLLDMAR